MDAIKLVPICITGSVLLLVAGGCYALILWGLTLIHDNGLWLGDPLRAGRRLRYSLGWILLISGGLATTASLLFCLLLFSHS